MNESDATTPKLVDNNDTENRAVLFLDAPPQQQPSSSFPPSTTTPTDELNDNRDLYPNTTKSPPAAKTRLECMRQQSSRNRNGRPPFDSEGSGRHQHEYECHLVITPKTSKDNTQNRHGISSSLSAHGESYGYPSSPQPSKPSKTSVTVGGAPGSPLHHDVNFLQQTPSSSYGTVGEQLRRPLSALKQYRSAHCHSPEELRITAEQSSARRKLIISSIICLVFMVVEAVGGVLSGSLAVLTDSAHLLSDFASFMIQLFAIWLASRARTTSMSFGWYRAETIGALTSIMVIWVVTGILVYIAIERIIRGDLHVNPLLMLITSAFGIFVNIIMAVALHPPHTHSHQHDHDHEAAALATADPVSNDVHTPLLAASPTPTSTSVHKKPSGFLGGVNLNVRAALIHVIGDLVQSIGVFVAALVIYFIPGTEIADPICTFLFSVLVLLTTITILRDIINVLMEGSPRNIDFAQVQALLSSIPGVVRIHNLRMWGLSMDKLAVNAHLVIDGDIANSRQVLHDALRSLHGTFNNLYETTIQIEEYEADMDDCTKCIEDDPAVLIG